MHFDLPLDELIDYLPSREEPPDFEEFWINTLQASDTHELSFNTKPVEIGFQHIDCFDLTFSGYAGQPIKAWFLTPKKTAAEETFACVVEFVSYGGGRGFPFEWLLWSNFGYAHLVMDTRGQGSEWRHGDTPDLHLEVANPQFPGVMTDGILDPQTYYYRRLFVDAIRAVRVARQLPHVDSNQLAVTGRSQGGGVALAIAGLDDQVSICMPDVPFLCHFRRAVEITDCRPYAEISGFLRVHRDKVDQVFHTLSYFDGVNFAARAHAEALFSVALMDMTCPPSTIFAAYNHYAGAKDMRVWPYNEHEGGQSHQDLEKIQFLRDRWPVI
jgi:cephalosporin-C deacetylase